MPDEDGYEFIRKLRTRPATDGGGIPAVALTAYARDEDRRRAIAAGYQMHVAKPVDLADLISTIGKLVRPVN